jgi:GT2 family glycosyltransferase/tetratricopeptide (TPR) repeat protein/2-polyprenyl-3-methyl-5-hydroxy-6-metoxy-1,4-benzoquinol methylase/glycosyltransferase involved in cell wall biosynthesis
MPIRRVAVLFDNQARPDTTGGYCLRALAELAQLEHFLPTATDRIPRHGFDLYVRIDDGLDWLVPDDLRPCVWWAIDTHLGFDRCLAQACRADVVFASQRDGAEQLRQAGVSSASWLPLACDPAVHRPHNRPKEFDVCFIGNLPVGPRTEILERLRHRFPNTFVGRRYFDEMAQTYSAARTVLNRSIRNDINMRVFEAVACGSLLATNDLRDNGQDELFRDGVHLATYTDAEDLLDKVAFYLRRPELRARIERAGREESHAKHTYRLRMERMLAEAEKLPTRLPAAAVSVTPPVADAGQFVPGSTRVFGHLADPAYFEFARPELLACVPPTARDVLDVGCGAGLLGKALKERQAARVTGVELDEGAARRARRHLDEVLVGDVEGRFLPFDDASFDCVVCGDVLEHLRDPLAFLRRLRSWLRPGGTLVASLPNVRHHSVVRPLLAGHWTYEAAGLLDRTHLRFFTRREVEKLLFRAGFTPESVTVLASRDHAEWVAQGRLPAVKVGGLHITLASSDEAEEFYAYQYLVVAQPTSPQECGHTSIVVLTHNQLPFTQQCVASLRLFTDEPYELVFVDNASTDGTAEYLKALADQDPRLRVVSNDTNRGFPAGVNQGMRVAHGRQVLLLNNDTVLTTGWLKRLLRALHAEPSIGLVGPCSNCVSGEQQVSVAYDSDLTDLDGFAWDWGKAHDGQREDTDRLVGFCLLIRREVIDAIGLLDDRFGLGCFEDDDYCRRALRAGFKAVIARDAFIHHFGSCSFAGAGIDQAGLLHANRELFRRKWEDNSASLASRPEALTNPAAAKGTDDLKLLVIAHVGFFRNRLDKSHFYRYEALARQPGVTLFGPGLPGYRPGLSVQEAVEIACAGVWPDVILHGGDLRASNEPLVHGLAEAPVLTALELLDSWTFVDRQIAFIRSQRFAVGLMQEAGHHLALYQQHCPDTAFFWTPNAVNTQLFLDHGQSKDYDIIVYGSISPDVYPLRARLAKLLSRQGDLRVRYIEHPGYYPETGMANIFSGEKLSREINRAWIGVATRSIYQCFLMKYLEIAASHALVAGDLPDSARAVFQEDCIELSLGQSDEEILAELRNHLADKERLRDMTEAAHQRVVREFSTDAFARRVLGLFRQILAKRRRPKEVPSIRPNAGAAAGTVQASARESTTPPFALSLAPGGGLLLRSTAPLLSLCMIVRNNASIITACLESIRPWVDEMIVVDTGSTDETPQIAARLGARVFHFPWCDSFSAARNESLRHACGQWIFWMDSDDVIDAANGLNLRELALREVPAALMGYVMQVRCPGAGPNGNADVTVVDHIKLIRNRPELRFEGRLHEQILPAIRRAGGETAWTDLFVVHAGYDHSPAGQQQKLERDLRLLHLELQEQPNHPFTLFNLGMTYADVGKYAEAVQHLQESIAWAGPGESHLRKAYALLVYCYAQTKNTEIAWQKCQQGLLLFPQDVELRFRQAILLHELGQLREAARVYENILADPGERHFTSIDAGIRGFKARQNLALVYADLGDWPRAEEQWRQIVAERPDYRAGWRGLADVMLARRQPEEVRNIGVQLAQSPRLRSEGLILQGLAAIARGDPSEARRQLEQALREFPDDPEPLQMLCRYLFERGSPAEAEQAMVALVRRQPEDAAAHRNLGVILLRQQRHAEALLACRESVRLRPESADTHLHLGHALQALGRNEEALAAWEQALRLEPGNADAAVALAQLRSAPGECEIRIAQESV